MNKKKQQLLPTKGLLPITARKLQDLLGPDCTLHRVEPDWKFIDIVPTVCAKVRSGSLFIPHYETNKECIEKIHQGALAVLTDHLLPDPPDDRRS